MKIVIADDHALIREGLHTVLVQTKTATSVIESETLDALNDALKAHQDIGLVLLDLSMPGMHGVETLTQLQDSFPTVSFAILSATEVRTVAQRFLAAGAAGYIPKSINNDGLLSAIRLMQSGNIFVPPFAIKSAGSDKAQAIVLTDRQSDVLNLMVRGMSNKEIARTLEISESTVKTHTSAVIKAFDVNNRIKAINEAIRLGMVEAP